MAGYKQEGLVQFVMDSVYSLAHAVHNMLAVNCPNGFVRCPHLRNITGEPFLQYIRNVSFIGTLALPAAAVAAETTAAAVVVVVVGAAAAAAAVEFVASLRLQKHQGHPTKPHVCTFAAAYTCPCVNRSQLCCCTVDFVAAKLKPQFFIIFYF